MRSRRFSYSMANSKFDARALIERLGLRNEDRPIVLCPKGTVLKRPSDTQIGACLGITPEIDPEHVYDVAVVGAGPAALATAVYVGIGRIVRARARRACARWSGRRVIADRKLSRFADRHFGPGIGPARVYSGTKFGAEIAIPFAVENLHCGKKVLRPHAGFGLQLAGDRSAQARTLVIASGIHYRRPRDCHVPMFEGAGVSYWASPIKATLCAGEHVALVGAGNSAGQAVVFLADKVKTLHLMVRGTDLGASLSQYLVDRIRALPNVKVHLRTEVIALSSDADNGLVSTVPPRHLSLFIGADPNTDWLKNCSIALDAHDFVRIGDLLDRNSWCASERAPLPLETTVPGVFAIGDVRAGSTKRVASAVGEGARTVAAIHSILSQKRGGPDEQKLQSPRHDSTGHTERPRLRGVHQDQCGMVSSACVSNLRPCRLLRSIVGPACDQALPVPQTSDHRRLGSAERLGRVFCRGADDQSAGSDAATRADSTTLLNGAHRYFLHRKKRNTHKQKRRLPLLRTGGVGVVAYASGWIVILTTVCTSACRCTGISNSPV